jgi:hypothetical protein
MWMTAQVLKHADPNLGGHAYAAACGVPRSMTHRTNGFRSGAVTYGLRWDCRSHGGRHARRDLLYPAAEEYPLTAPQHEHRYVFNHHLATYYGEPFEAGVAAEFGYLTAAL